MKTGSNPPDINRFQMNMRKIYLYKHHLKFYIHDRQWKGKYDYSRVRHRLSEAVLAVT